MLVLSAIGFGFMPLFREWSVRDGCGTVTMLALRFAIAGAVLVGWCALARKKLPAGHILGVLTVMGAALYVGESLGYFKAIDAGASPALVAMLLYTYPAIVTVGARVFFKERVTRIRWAAVLLAMLGTGLTVWGPMDAAPVKGIALGLFTAASYAAYILVGSRLPKDVDPAVSSCVVIVSAALVLCGAAAITRSPMPQSSLGWLGIACLALVSTVMSLTLFLAGLRLAGPVRASTISTVEALTAVVVSSAFLGERLSPLQMIGGGLIIVAAVMSAKYGGNSTTQPDKGAS
ncbi:MAG TPA: DMT family transporter [Phycisphaerales bacterium]|nr:DMT family transporter [Phycisphaerales bacterium]